MNKLAVFEMDVHDIKMTIYRYTANAFFDVEQQIVEPVGIIQDMERDGYIKPTRIQEVINILRNLNITRSFFSCFHIAAKMFAGSAAAACFCCSIIW